MSEQEDLPEELESLRGYSRRRINPYNYERDGSGSLNIFTDEDRDLADRISRKFEDMEDEDGWWGS